MHQLTGCNSLIPYRCFSSSPQCRRQICSEHLLTHCGLPAPELLPDCLLTVDKLWPAKPRKLLCHSAGCNHTFSNKVSTSTLRSGLPSKFLLPCLPLLSPNFRIILHLIVFYHSFILYIYLPSLNHYVISVSFLDPDQYPCFQMYWSLFAGVQFVVESICTIFISYVVFCNAEISIFVIFISWLVFPICLFIVSFSLLLYMSFKFFNYMLNATYLNFCIPLSFFKEYCLLFWNAFSC